MTRYLDELTEEIAAIMARYPSDRRRSGMIPLLWAVQRKLGHVPHDAYPEIANYVGSTAAEVEEAVTFYTMFHRQPVGRFVLQVCKTLPCALCGGLGLSGYLRERLGVGLEETTSDGLFMIQEVECLGACSEAPLMLVNEKLETKLTREKVDRVLDECRAQAGASARKAS
jgi:NADH-quinone oxidoreductase subunit E